MREPHVTGPLPPRDWNEAFAALPPETPSADALQRVLAQWPAPVRRRSSRLPLALAASLLALAVILAFARHSRVASDSPMAVQSGNPDVVLDGRSGNPAAVPSQSHPVADSTVKAAIPVEAQKLDAHLRGHGEQKHDAVNPAEALPTDSTPTRIAKAATPRHKPQRARTPAPTNDAIDRAAMEPLYAESARLEALLALASDDRVASATAVALGSDFEARLSGIDAALMQPSLPAQRRQELWRERVSALRAYASFESTQRALAARGERYDAMLVSID